MPGLPYKKKIVYFLGNPSNILNTLIQSSISKECKTTYVTLNFNLIILANLVNVCLTPSSEDVLKMWSQKIEPEDTTRMFCQAQLPSGPFRGSTHLSVIGTSKFCLEKYSVYLSDYILRENQIQRVNIQYIYTLPAYPVWCAVNWLPNNASVAHPFHIPLTDQLCTVQHTRFSLSGIIAVAT